MTNTSDKNKTTVIPANSLSPSLPKTKNALIHGISASDNVLPWESEGDFEKLFTDLQTEWAPEGRSEQETVLSLARLHWLKHRLMRATRLASLKDPFIAELDEAGVKNWDDVERLIREKSTTDSSVIDLAKKSFEDLSAALNAAKAMMTMANPDTGEITKQVGDLHDLFSKFVVPHFSKAREQYLGPDSKLTGPANNADPKATAVHSSYHPDYLEKIIRLDASIDARIDKTLARLTSIKEYKRIAKANAPKEISSASNVAA